MHAIVVAPVLIRLEMLRIERTYDLLITRHSLADSGGNSQGRGWRVRSSFYGRRGSLEMELWGNDVAFRGTVCPVFYTRAGNVWCCQRLARCGDPNHICRVLPRMPSLSFARTSADCSGPDGGSQRA